MKFSLRKLPKSEASSSMKKVPVRLFKPYIPLLAPVYTLLEKNEKFVAVKAPLGFFSPTELEKFRSVADFYLPRFIERVAPFQEAGEHVQRLLGLSEVQTLQTSAGAKETQVPISPFQLSDAVLQAISPLWGREEKIEPFFLVFFAGEICEPLADARCAGALELGVSIYELALLRASFAVFVALHAGFLVRRQLSQIRDRVFDETVRGTETVSRQQRVDAAVSIAHRMLADGEVREIKISDFVGTDLVSKRIQSRLERVRQSLIPPGSSGQTVFGEGGVCGE